MNTFIILGIVIFILLFIMMTYNRLVAVRNKVRNQWAQVDVQLKRRFDLIPNLVETVKGYAKHERETLEEVVKARTAYTTASDISGEIDASNQLTGALSKLFALSESYPDLKANTNFLELQRELSDTENKISTARQAYNNAVMAYNNKIEKIPSNIIAGIFNFKAERFFEANEAEKENVKVTF